GVVEQLAGGAGVGGQRGAQRQQQGQAQAMTLRQADGGGVLGHDQFLWNALKSMTVGRAQKPAPRPRRMLLLSPPARPAPRVRPIFGVSACCTPKARADSPW